MGRAFPDPFEAFLENRQAQNYNDLDWERQKGSFWSGEAGFAGANLGLAALGITGGLLGGAVGMAGYFAGSAAYDAYHEAEYGGAINLRQEATAVNRLMKPLITSGPELGMSGRGLNVGGATRMAGGMAGMAKQRGLSNEDMRAVLSASVDEGLLNDVNTSGMALDKLEKVMGLMGQVAKLTGSPDFQRNLQYIGQLSRMGAGVDEISPMLSNMAPFARMAGVDVGSAMQQGGAMGAMSFAQAGFAPTMGIQTGVMAQGVARAAVASGQISPGDLARMGGEEGVAGGVQGGITTFYNKMRDYAGYFAMRGEGGNFELDKTKVARFLSDNTSIEEVRQQSLQFVANMSRAEREQFARSREGLMTGLQETMGAENALAGVWAFSRKMGRQYETPLMSSESVLLGEGFGALEAKALDAAFSNTGVQGAMLQQRRAGQMRTQASAIVDRQSQMLGSTFTERLGRQWDRMDMTAWASFQFGQTEFETLSELQGKDIQAELAAVGMGGTAVNTLLTGSMDEMTRSAITQISEGGEDLIPRSRRGALRRMDAVSGMQGMGRVGATRAALGGGIQDVPARNAFIRATGGETGVFTNTAMEQMLGGDYQPFVGEEEIAGATGRIRRGVTAGTSLEAMRDEARAFAGFGQWMEGKTDSGQSRLSLMTGQYNMMLRGIKGNDYTGAPEKLERGLKRVLMDEGYTDTEATRGARAFIGTKMQEEAGSGATRQLQALMRGGVTLDEPGTPHSLSEAQRMASEKTTELHKALGVETTEDIASINEIVRKSGKAGIQYMSLLAAKDYMNKEGADTKAAADTSTYIEDEMLAMREKLSPGQRATIEKAVARGVGGRLFEGEGQFRQATDSTDTLNWQQFRQTLGKAGGLAGEAAPMMQRLQAMQLESTLEEYYDVDVQELSGLLTGRVGGAGDERLKRLREMRETMRRATPAGANQRMVLQRFDEIVEMMPKLPSGELASFRTSEKLLTSGQVTRESLKSLDPDTRAKVEGALGVEGGLNTEARKTLQRQLGTDYEKTMRQLAVRDQAGELTGKEGVSAWQLSQQLEGGKTSEMVLGAMASGLQAGGLQLLGGGKNIGTATKEELDAAMAQGGGGAGGMAAAGGGASATALTHAAAQLNIAANNLRKATGGMGRSRPPRRGMGTLPGGRGW